MSLFLKEKEVIHLQAELVSVICTVKNGERTISETIESVLAQNYTNWEFVIVDDGSTDTTINILNRYSHLDKRIKVIQTGGIGRGSALNKAVENATGNYICNIDADDLMHPQKIQIHYEYMNQNKEYFLITTGSELIYEDAKPDWKIYDNDFSLVKEIGDSLFVDNQIGHSSVMMKREILIEIGCYDEGRKSQFDYELWLRAFCENLKLGKVDEKLTAKRIHKNQSYENKKRLTYLYRNTSLKINYILKYNKKKYRIFYAIILFILGLLPFKIRMVVRNIQKNIKS